MKPGPALVAAVRRSLAGRERPLLVAVDGPSGSGKTTIASLLADALNGAVVPGDDFFAAALTDDDWSARTPEERARDAIDWKRLRSEALEPLLAGSEARWRPFDFTRGPRPDGSYAMSTEVVVLEPRPTIILDGAYSARPELSDLIDLAILVDAPAEIRRDRLAEREDPQFLGRWHERWDTAEAYYFTHVRPRSSFDLVVRTD